MKTIQQVLGFVQGWQQALSETNNTGCDIYHTLLTIEKYIKEE
jgi:hypothetical protein